MSEKLGKFRRYIDVYVPIEACTLRCPYCYITHHRKFNNKIEEFHYDVATWKIAFDQERWGGRCLVNFCAGGETLVAPIMIDYIRATLEQGHYVMIVTNGTIDKSFERIAEFPREYIERIFFKFSYHYQQLIERNLVERFFNNIRKMRDVGASFTLELTPHDEIIPCIDDIKALAVKELGAWPHITVARDEHYMKDLPILTKLSREDYKKAWSSFDSELFDFKLSIFNQKRKEFCNAGNWVLRLDMQTGILDQCYCSHYKQNILENPQKAIDFLSIGHFCTEPHCFNGHSQLGFGAIQSISAPTYTMMRNRVCVDGSEWLSSAMKDVMSTKLYNTNPPLTFYDKILCDIRVLCKIFKRKTKKMLNKILL